MRVVLALAIAFSAMLLIPSSATARSSCFGCNIVDTGKVGSLAAGELLYLESTGGVVEVQVQAVEGQVVRVRTAQGAVISVAARQLYERAELDERRSAAAAGATVGVLGAVTGPTPEGQGAERMPRCPGPDPRCPRRGEGRR